ncbi:mucin-19 isoform X2 [Engraulis encrasicolus]|uniref:mucin-19 isoform X2 n=1 Tax=Engraulis encrasicolus TaxID=184585 RepID=UPI002FD43BD5
MGNENSAPDEPPQEGTTDSVVLFPPQADGHSEPPHQAEVNGEGSPSAKRESRAENGSAGVHTSLPTVAQGDEDTLRRRNRRSPSPRLQGGAGGGGAAAGEEDLDELEFPHDLLPSTDLSTELNLNWGSALGREQVSSGAMKSEAVALSGSANPLLAGLQQYMDARPPVRGIVKSTPEEEGDPVLHSGPRPQSHVPVQGHGEQEQQHSRSPPAPHSRSPSPHSRILPPSSRSPSPHSRTLNHPSRDCSPPHSQSPQLHCSSSSEQINLELQAALQECEEQMASFAQATTGPSTPSSQVSVGESLSEAMAKKEGKRKKRRKKKGASLEVEPSSCESSFHGDNVTVASTGSKKEEEEKEEVAHFSFTSYILGNASGGAGEGEKELENSKVSEETERESQTETNAALKQEETDICLPNVTETKPTSTPSEEMQKHLPAIADSQLATEKDKDSFVQTGSSTATCKSCPPECAPVEANISHNAHKTEGEVNLVVRLPKNESDQASAETALFPQTSAETEAGPILTDSAPRVNPCPHAADGGGRTESLADTDTQQAKGAPTKTETQPPEKPQTQTQPQAWAESEAQKQTSTETEKQTLEQTGAEPEPQKQTQAQTSTQTETETQEQPQTQARSETPKQTLTRAQKKKQRQKQKHKQAQTDAHVQAQTEAQPPAQAQTQAQTHSQTQTQTSSRETESNKSPNRTFTLTSPGATGSDLQEQLIPQRLEEGGGDFSPQSLNYPATPAHLTPSESTPAPPSTLPPGLGQDQGQQGDHSQTDGSTDTHTCPIPSTCTLPQPDLHTHSKPVAHTVPETETQTHLKTNTHTTAEPDVHTTPESSTHTGTEPETTPHCDQSIVEPDHDREAAAAIDPSHRGNVDDDCTAPEGSRPLSPRARRKPTGRLPVKLENELEIESRERIRKQGQAETLINIDEEAKHQEKSATLNQEQKNTLSQDEASLTHTHPQEALSNTQAERVAAIQQSAQLKIEQQQQQEEAKEIVNKEKVLSLDQQTQLSIPSSVGEKKERRRKKRWRGVDEEAPVRSDNTNTGRASLPLTTPTMPEMIESEGVRERERAGRESRVRGSETTDATVKEVLDTDAALGEAPAFSELCAPLIPNGEREQRESQSEPEPDPDHGRSLIFSQSNCSPALKEEDEEQRGEKNTVSSSICSSSNNGNSSDSSKSNPGNTSRSSANCKMPQNSLESEEKGGGQPANSSPGTEALSPAEEGGTKAARTEEDRLLLTTSTTTGTGSSSSSTVPLGDPSKLTSQEDSAERLAGVEESDRRRERGERVREEEEGERERERERERGEQRKGGAARQRVSPSSEVPLTTERETASPLLSTTTTTSTVTDRQAETQQQQHHHHSSSNDRGSNSERINLIPDEQRSSPSPHSSISARSSPPPAGGGAGSSDSFNHSSPPPLAHTNSGESQKKGEGEGEGERGAELNQCLDKATVAAVAVAEKEGETAKAKGEEKGAFSATLAEAAASAQRALLAGASQQQVGQSHFALNPHQAPAGTHSTQPGVSVALPDPQTQQAAAGKETSQPFGIVTSQPTPPQSSETETTQPTTKVTSQQVPKTQPQPGESQFQSQSPSGMWETVSSYTSAGSTLTMKDGRCAAETVGVATTNVDPKACASLPPLTVHESLRHPVTESSFGLKEYYGIPERRTEGPPSETHVTTSEPDRSGNSLKDPKGEQKSKSSVSGKSLKDHKQENSKTAEPGGKDTCEKETQKQLGVQTAGVVVTSDLGQEDGQAAQSASSDEKTPQAPDAAMAASRKTGSQKVAGVENTVDVAGSLPAEDKQSADSSSSSMKVGTDEGQRAKVTKVKEVKGDMKAQHMAQSERVDSQNDSTLSHKKESISKADSQRLINGSERRGGSQTAAVDLRLEKENTEEKRKDGKNAESSTLLVSDDVEKLTLDESSQHAVVSARLTQQKEESQQKVDTECLTREEPREVDGKHCADAKDLKDVQKDYNGKSKVDSGPVAGDELNQPPASVSATVTAAQNAPTETESTTKSHVQSGESHSPVIDPNTDRPTSGDAVPKAPGTPEVTPSTVRSNQSPVTSNSSHSAVVTAKEDDSTEINSTTTDLTQRPDSHPLLLTQQPTQGTDSAVTPQPCADSSSQAATAMGPAAVPTIVLKTPGPMLSHRELVNDCDITSSVEEKGDVPPPLSISTIAGTAAGEFNGPLCSIDKQGVAQEMHTTVPSQPIKQESAGEGDSTQRKVEKDRASPADTPSLPVSDGAADKWGNNASAVQAIPNSSSSSSGSNITSSSRGSKPEETGKGRGVPEGCAVMSVCETGSKTSEAASESVSPPRLHSQALESVTSSIDNKPQITGLAAQPDSTKKSMDAAQASMAKLDISGKSNGVDGSAAGLTRVPTCSSAVTDLHPNEPLAVNHSIHAGQRLGGDVTTSVVKNVTGDTVKIQQGKGAIEEKQQRVVGEEKVRQTQKPAAKSVQGVRSEPAQQQQEGEKTQPRQSEPNEIEGEQQQQSSKTAEQLAAILQKDNMTEQQQQQQKDTSQGRGDRHETQTATQRKMLEGFESDREGSATEKQAGSLAPDTSEKSKRHSDTSSTEASVAAEQSKDQNGARVGPIHPPDQPLSSGSPTAVHSDTHPSVFDSAQVPQTEESCRHDKQEVESQPLEQSQQKQPELRNGQEEALGQRAVSTQEEEETGQPPRGGDSDSTLEEQSQGAKVRTTVNKGQKVTAAKPGENMAAFAVSLSGDGDPTVVSGSGVSSQASKCGDESESRNILYPNKATGASVADNNTPTSVINTSASEHSDAQPQRPLSQVASECTVTQPHTDRGRAEQGPFSEVDSEHSFSVTQASETKQEASVPITFNPQQQQQDGGAPAIQQRPPSTTDSPPVSASSHTEAPHHPVLSGDNANKSMRLPKEAGTNAEQADPATAMGLEACPTEHRVLQNSDKSQGSDTTEDTDSSKAASAQKGNTTTTKTATATDIQQPVASGSPDAQRSESVTANLEHQRGGEAVVLAAGGAHTDTGEIHENTAGPTQKQAEPQQNHSHGPDIKPQQQQQGASAGETGDGPNRNRHCGPDSSPMGMKGSDEGVRQRGDGREDDTKVVKQMENVRAADPAVMDSKQELGHQEGRVGKSSIAMPTSTTGGSDTPPQANQAAPKSFIEMLRESAVATETEVSGPNVQVEEIKTTNDSLISAPAAEEINTNKQGSGKDPAVESSSSALLKAGSGLGQQPRKSGGGAGSESVCQPAEERGSSHSESSQEQSGGSNWLTALREAAAEQAHSESDHTAGPAEKNTDIRPIPALDSPQGDLEFRTPSEEFPPPPPLDEPTEDTHPDSRSFPPPPAERSAPIPPASPRLPPPGDQPHLHVFPPSPPLPAHLLQDAAEFPTPPPTPPDRIAPPPPATAAEPIPSPPASPRPPQARRVPPSPPPRVSSVPQPQPPPPPPPPPTSPPPVPPPSSQDQEWPQPPALDAPGSPVLAVPACLPPDPAPVPPPPPPPPPSTQDRHFPPPPPPCPAPPARSSDSDGAFETPESTTPVKVASPVLPAPEGELHSQHLPSEDTGFYSGPGSVADVTLTDPLPASSGDAGGESKSPTRSSSSAFDEDKPIAASGAYDLDALIAAAAAADPYAASNSARSPLTRSLSLQAGELDQGSGPVDKSTSGSDRLLNNRAEAFSVGSGTESAPGTLRRGKKPIRTGSLKKKPLSRQNSNPESTPPKSASTSSTPEVKKKSKPRAESPLLAGEETAGGSATASPAGTLRRNRVKPVRVDSPPPLVEETTPPSPSPAPTPVATSSIAPPSNLYSEDTPLPAPKSAPVVDEDSPIPPAGSYNWDPDNFDNIDPFRTGGSKIANSPELARKSFGSSAAGEDPDDKPLPTTSTTAAAATAAPTTAASKAAVSAEDATISTPAGGAAANPEEQPLNKRQPVRLEFDYSEEGGDAPSSNATETPPAQPPAKKLGKKPGAKMPLRKPKIGLRKPATTAPSMEQLDNAPIAPPSEPVDIDDIPIGKGSYSFDPSKWDDPNFNPFTSKSGCGVSGGGVPNSPPISTGKGYTFDPDSFNDSVDPFKSTNKMSNSPPKTATTSSSAFEVSANDTENGNDNVGELEDQNQNKLAKKKKPVKSNTFRIKKSPKRTPMKVASAQQDDDDLDDDSHADENPAAPSQGHATDEEKLASSTNQKERLVAGSTNTKWASRQEMEAELHADAEEDFPQPSDLTAFVNENNRAAQNDVADYGIEYMEKIGTGTPPLSSKKPPMYLKLDSVADSTSKSSEMQASDPSSPCTGSFEEMEAQITAGSRSPVLPPARTAPEGSASEKSSRKREADSHPHAHTHAAERDGAPPMQEPAESPSLPLLGRLAPDLAEQLSYMEPDLAETNPSAFAHKLQEELVLAALRMEALQVAQCISQSQIPSLAHVPPTQREASSPAENLVCKTSLYTRPGYSEAESPYLPRELDHSLGIAREEIVAKEKEVLEWKRKYEESRQEVVEMRRIVAEYEKTIAQMIEDDQRDKSLSHHTIQQLILEKDQALSDLNSVEKSLADLFRRYEKMKDVLEGFRKNEEVLKKCAQEYLARVRKEEQRYQALKIHAEEKLDKANTDIAQVRAKAKQEQAAYQASLRKEQMKVDSLERTLEQKNKEIEELTKICDELISKMGRT